MQEWQAEFQLFHSAFVGGIIGACVGVWTFNVFLILLNAAIRGIKWVMRDEIEMGK